jgi:hypothetical protein
MQTFLAGQEYKKNVTSKLARFMEFKKVVDNRVNWNADPESVPNISFFQTNELYKWDVYTHTKITNLDYHFFQNRLCGIDFYIWDKKQAKNMDGILQIKFGEGQSEGINGRRWDVNGITVMSTPYTTARRFMFRHQETWTEKEKYEKKYATTAN